MTTLLIVDDDHSITDILRSVCEDEGYRVVVAGNGREAMECLKVERPDLVLCDVMMPSMDGRTVCRNMKADPELRSIPFLLMSAARDFANDKSCGYDAFIPKPFDLDELLETISDSLNSKDSAAS